MENVKIFHNLVVNSVCFFFLFIRRLTPSSSVLPITTQVLCSKASGSETFELIIIIIPSDILS